MLASMGGIDRRADTPLVDWSDLAVSGLLPTGTVTLLLADVEGSTRLWEGQPGEMTGAVARLNQTVSGAIAAHGGVRPVEQGEGDSFVAAFPRASDAVACALELQRAPLARRFASHRGEYRPTRRSSRCVPRSGGSIHGYEGIRPQDLYRGQRQGLRRAAHQQARVPATARYR